MTTNLPTSSGSSSSNIPAGETLMNFRAADFMRRVDAVVELTGEYGGQLTTAWDQARNVSDLKSKAKAPKFSSDVDPVQMRNLLKSIRNSHVRSVVVETAHAYMYDDLDNEQFRQSLVIQLQQANLIAAELESTGVHVEKLLFVDDYNPKPGSDKTEDTLDLDAYLELAAEQGFPPDLLIMEGDLADTSKAMVDYMQHHQGLVLAPDSSNGDGRKLLERKNVELIKENGMVTCSALDAALSILKFRHMAQGIVNVLPRRTNNAEIGVSFNSQQRKVRNILTEHLNARVMSFFNYFVSGDRNGVDAAGANNKMRKDVKRTRGRSN